MQKTKYFERSYLRTLENGKSLFVINTNFYSIIEYGLNILSNFMFQHQYLYFSERVLSHLFILKLCLTDYQFSWWRCHSM